MQSAHGGKLRIRNLACTNPEGCACSPDHKVGLWWKEQDFSKLLIREGHEWQLRFFSFPFLNLSPFLLQSRLNEARTPLPLFFSSCLPLFSGSPSASVILHATQTLPFPFLMSLNTRGVWCIHPKELEGTWHGISFLSCLDSALLPWLSCSDIPTVRSATLKWLRDTIVLSSEFSGKFICVLWREVSHQSYLPLPLPSSYWFCLWTSLIVIQRQRVLPLCMSDTGQPGFFQRKQQGNEVWERKWHQRGAIKPAPDEGKFDFMSAKGESRRSWKEQVSQEKKGNALIKTELAHNQTAVFFWV